MHQAAHAYARTAQATQSPRQLEATILMRAATRLQGVADDWSGRSGELAEALTYNRKLWTALVAATSNPEHPLPDAVRQNIANLGLFIFNHTLSVLAAPAPEKLAILVSINRELAGGLRAAPAPAAAAA